MLHKLILSTIIISLSTLLFAGGIKENKYYNWNQAGAQYQLNENKTISMWAFNCDYRGRVSNNFAYNQALNELGEKGGTIFFKQGVYLFNEPINVPSNVIIKGEGSGSILVFDLIEENDAININGKLLTTLYTLSANAYKGYNSIELEHAEGIEIGNLLRISLAESNLTSSDWAKGSVAQILEVKEVIGNQIVFSTNLRLDFNYTNSVKIQKIEPVVNAGISCLKILRMDTTLGQTSNINFSYASNCFVKTITSEYANFAHIEINNSYKVTVEGSYFHLANGYGEGGKGYGVMLQFSSSDCLVEDNIFEQLRHAMILQAGANGNVLAYNYSTKPYWQQANFPENAAGDLVLHGNYPFANLFEGNVVQNIVVDASHGKNGHHNTFFKNTAQLFGFFINPGAGDSMNIIGTQITRKDFLYGNYIINGFGHYENSNIVKGKILPAKSTDIEEKSMYLGKESGYTSPKGNNQNGIIAAQERYNKGIYAICNTPLEIDESIGNIEYVGIENTETINSIYPNPAHNFININFEDYKYASLINTEGKVVLSSAETTLNLTGVPKGVYFVKIELKNNETAYKKVLIY